MPKDSLAKVLKVVKPPQKPVTSSSFISGDSTPLLTKPTSSPISREPRILTAKVPQGYEVFNEEIRYLITDPMAPPNATNNRFLIIINSNFAAKVRKIGQNYVFLPQQNRFSVKKWLGNSNIAVKPVATKPRCTKAEDSSARRFVPCRVPTARASRTSWWVGLLPTWHHRIEARSAGSVYSAAAIISDYGMDILVPSARVRCYRLERKSFGPDKSKSLTCFAGQGFLFIYGMALSHEVTDMAG